MGFGAPVTKKPEFKKVNDYVWDIAPSFKQGMRVPGRVYASRKILDEMDLQVYDQLSNVATLPGILKHALCMPDGHSGYGFPIGGVAAFDAEEGVISPGGVGFDINCVAAGSKVQLQYGTFKRIEELEHAFDKHSLSIVNLQNKSLKSAKAAIFLKKKPDCRVLKLKTTSGFELTLTEDHPVYNGTRMVNGSELRAGDFVSIRPFEGVEYETPSEEVIANEADVLKIVGNRKNIVKILKARGLLPLRYDSLKLPILARLVGFLTGDGWLGKYYSKKLGHFVYSSRAIGKPEDLQQIQWDLNELGFEAAHMTTKKYESRITGTDGTQHTLSGVTSQIYLNSQSLTALLKFLGVPEGNKSRCATTVPQWVKNAPLWIKRLYLAGLFGAELTKPLQRKGEETSFTEPSFSQNKILSLERENQVFLEEISSLLREFGVSVNNVYRQAGVRTAKGDKTAKLSLRISAKPSNLINLWTRVGYEYCKERKAKSALAVAYLKTKQTLLKNLEAIRQKAVDGTADRAVLFEQADEYGIKRVTLRSWLRSDRISAVRIPQSFPTFKEFCQQHALGESEIVLDKIESNQEVAYDNYVYDFTVNDDNHTFIANGIVTHNCGMRLVTTNLTIDEVKPKLKELVELLFRRVPAGVGSEGFVKLNAQEFRKVVMEGGRWCVEKGYGWEEDLRRTEESGCVEGADEKKVSDTAVKRGLNQIGTLGSGNHYLEVQWVKPENIFDEKAAKAYGIFPNQVVVMFHCGSRGFGHQVATDYLSVFLSVMEKKYGIKILDRELACAPFQSPEGQNYFAAMKCGLNMSFANRQVILHRIRECFSKVFGKSPEALEMRQVYDVAHNTAKLEEYGVDGKTKKVLVHRKGATRSFGPGMPDVPPEFRSIGQPVIIGGSMETGSYLLAGTQTAMEETWGSTAHGSGRTMSRTRAKSLFRGDQLQKDMERKGILVKSVSYAGLAEEAGAAYKDIDEVIDACHNAGISRKVVKLLPVANVKG